MKLKLNSLPAQIGLALLAGVIAGLLMGKDAGFLGNMSKVIINLIKAIAGPLLFIAVLDAFLKAEFSGKSTLRMVGVALLNGCIALALGLGLSALFEPGYYFERPNHVLSNADAQKIAAFANQKIDFAGFIFSYIPSNVLEPFINNSILSIVLMSVLVGLAVKKVQHSYPTTNFSFFTEIILAVITQVLHYIIILLPLAVFGALAKTVGEYGFEPFKGLAAYVGVGFLGLSLQILIVYQTWIWGYAKMNLRHFWQEASRGVIFALGSNSSLATLPLTLEILEQKLGVSKTAARLGACVGTNLNNDGIILYEGMAVLFVAQAYHIDLTLGQQLLAAASCMVAAIGIAGVPEAGVVSLALALSTVGLPTELVPILISVDWILARCRSATNVLSDMTVSIVLNKAEAKNS